jgi:hypothetical protein
MKRRSLLKAGFCGTVGLSLAQYFNFKSCKSDIKNYESKEGSAKSVIFIFLPGGMAHQESFDPKPLSPIEYRGPLNSIQTNVPDVFLSQNWINTAKIMDKITICRSMTHGEAAHERGTHNMFTGYKPSPALSYPSMGAVVSHEFASKNNLPQYICIPNQPNEFAGTGYLSSSYAGFSLGSDPASANFAVRDLNLPSNVSVERFERRKQTLNVINGGFSSNSDSLVAVNSFYERAYGLLSSKEAKAAFDLSLESDKLKDEYGRNEAGMRMLMARRLVEAGSKFVTLTYGGWDMHDNISIGMSNQVPAFDQAYSRLILDLEERGLLNETLVCVCSEFGRTPKINNTSGRDHWPKVFSTVLAGGGIKKGLVYGTSNSTASEPEDNPVSIEDWAATIYHCIGINSDKELMAPGDRPIEIVDGGKVIKNILV